MLSIKTQTRFEVFVSPLRRHSSRRYYWLAHAGYALQYVPPDRFLKFWLDVREALVPGGVFAGHFFGKMDLFASDIGLSTFHYQELRQILIGWEVLKCDEYHGKGQRDPNRQWHFYTVCARKPR